MLLNFEEKNQAYDLLKSYQGDNPYIYYLKKMVVLYHRELTDTQLLFVLKNIDFKPIKIDNIITLTDWYAETKQKEWNLKYSPIRIYVSYLVGEMENYYVAYIKYSQRQENTICTFLSKKGVATALKIEPYTDIVVDFEKYDNISKNPKIKIKDFQKPAVQFLLKRKKAILADSQGYGKTIETIIAMLESNCKKALIICPASLKSNWKNELSNYVDEKEIEIIKGSKWKDNKYVIANYDILDNFYTVPEEISYKTVKDIDEDGNIVSRKEIAWKKKPKYNKNGDIIEDGIPKMKVSRNKELIKKAMEESQLFQSEFDLIIIDEVHKLCNATSGRYKIISDFLKRTNPEHIFLLSGTPISNRPYNFYNVLKLINAEITKDWEYYVKRYCDGKIIYIKGEKWKWSQLFLNRIHKTDYSQLTPNERIDLDNFLLRNAKHIWSTDGSSNLEELKEKTKHIYLRRLTSEIENMVDKKVITLRYDLSNEQKLEYDKLWDDYLEKLENEDIAHLRSQNKQVIESSLLRQYLANQMIPNTIELAESILEETNKLIIMCTFDSEIEALKEYFKDAAVVYNGKMTTTQKDKAEFAFKNYDHVKVFIGNLVASSCGLNLQVASRLIFNSFSWISGENRQGEDRIFRQTQTEDCLIYYQIFTDTFSEEMFDKVLNKENNINEIIKKETEK